MKLVSEVESNLGEKHEDKLKETLEKLISRYGSDESLKGSIHLYRALK